MPDAPVTYYEVERFAANRLQLATNGMAAIRFRLLGRDRTADRGRRGEFHQCESDIVNAAPRRHDSAYAIVTAAEIVGSLSFL